MFLCFTLTSAKPNKKIESAEKKTSVKKRKGAERDRKKGNSHFFLHLPHTAGSLVPEHKAAQQSFLSWLS